MKRWIPVIAIFLASLAGPAKACVFYPDDESIRFTLLTPSDFGFKDYTPLFYSSKWYYDPYWFSDNVSGKETNTGDSMNMAMWRRRCGDVPAFGDVHEAVYGTSPLNDPKTQNAFVHYLHQHHDTAALGYLSFARKCSPFNQIMDDPWERGSAVRIPKRDELIAMAVKKSRTVNDADLARRYTFLAIRLAWYNCNTDVVRTLWKQRFEGQNNKDIIYSWGLHFYLSTVKNREERNYLAAQVFTYAPDKRMAVHRVYENSIPIASTLAYANSGEERAAVWLLDAIRNPAKALDNIRHMYAEDPGAEGLDFLLLREVNKIEDWLGTPYYNNYRPSLADNDGVNWDVPWPEERIQKDKTYAREIIEFIASVDKNKIRNPVLWKVSSAYLQLLADQPLPALAALDEIKKDRRVTKKEALYIDEIRVLCMIRGRVGEQQKINQVAVDVFKHRRHKKFFFAVARELEYQGNTTYAALYLSMLKHCQVTAMDGDGEYWRSKKHQYTLWDDYFNEYFLYMDAAYTVTQIEHLVAKIRQPNLSEPDRVLCCQVKLDLPRLYDLLGTKYMRLNQLEKALKCFSMVNDTLWTSSHYQYRKYLDANPFYTDMYAEHRKTPADTITYDKESMVGKLLEHLRAAEDVNRKDRAYQYFLVANAYFNMTQYGNSWIMKRYYWTKQQTKSNLEDDDDYFGCKRAKAYYLKAQSVSRNKKFAALCLRMAVRCENYRLWYFDPGKKNNIYERKLEQQYPDDYLELTSNCESFSRYLSYGRTGG
ncbi:MAG: hypothetical protein H6585_07080 [Flavobacteriales bacterium]|nr:hypothetical protein [Flavobacteriales bacterium]MCB9448090.1 hypothetical protein [Flavobacteriales bacterium]